MCSRPCRKKHDKHPQATYEAAVRPEGSGWPGRSLAGRAKQQKDDQRAKERPGRDDVARSVGVG